VAEGTWTLRAAAADHASQTFTIDVTGDLAQNFSLSPFCNVIEDDVEAGNLGWTAQAPWAIVTEASHSPTHSWTDSPGGAYQNYADTSLTSPVFDLSGYEGVALNFWHQYDTESGYDYADVEYSTNGGTTWTAAASYDGTQLAWTQQQIPLPEMDGQANARIRFHFTTDVSITGDGWHVDDIVLYGGGPACVPAASPTAEFSSNSPVLLGDPVVFINETSGSEPLTYEWDFGDDTGTSTDPNPTYTFADVGTYMVVLTATNDFGMDVVSHAVEVLPTPDISVTPPALAASQAPDTTSTQMLEICNVGGEPLDWSLAEAEAVAKGASLPSNKSTAKSAENIIKAPAPERNHDPLAIVLEEGFEGGVIPPAGWTLDVTNSNYTWEIQYGTPFEGVYAAEILYDPALVPQDEVLLSSELNITNGVLDFWSYGSVYWCRDTYNNCDLDVWIVVGDWDGGSVDDIYVGTADGDWPANWTWANSTFDLTPLLPGGPVRLAFQYSGVDGAEVSLDNIILDVAFDIPWMSETPISGTVAPGACTTVDVTFDSNGLAPGVYTANLVVTSNDPDTPEITVPVSLTVEETEFLLYLPIILKNP
jgi:PKD repeat protein